MMPEFVGTISFVLQIVAKDEDEANGKLQYVSGLVAGYLSRTEFNVELRPQYISELKIETTFISRPGGG